LTILENAKVDKKYQLIKNNSTSTKHTLESNSTNTRGIEAFNEILNNLFSDLTNKVHSITLANLLTNKTNEAIIKAMKLLKSKVQLTLDGKMIDATKSCEENDFAQNTEKTASFMKTTDAEVWPINSDFDTEINPENLLSLNDCTNKSNLVNQIQTLGSNLENASIKEKYQPMKNYLITTKNKIGLTMANPREFLEAFNEKLKTFLQDVTAIINIIASDNYKSKKANEAIINSIKAVKRNVELTLDAQEVMSCGIVVKPVLG